MIRCRPRYERGREFLFTSKSVVDSTIDYIVALNLVVLISYSMVEYYIVHLKEMLFALYGCPRYQG